jgi:TfoX/Sxy family transcriptional regulator of competence genes
MSYNSELEEKIEVIVSPWDNLEKKKMFGGICYLVNGNMCFGIWKDYLIVRMAADLAAEKLMDANVKTFDITGKPMKGWVMIQKASWSNRDELLHWLENGRSFALTLPVKAKKEKTLEDVYYRGLKRGHR